MKQIFCLLILILSVNLIVADIVENNLFNETTTSVQNVKTKLNEEALAGKDMIALKGEKSKTSIPQIIKDDPDSRAYCSSIYTNQTDDWISNVSLHELNNTSGQEGSDSYGDYTSMSATLRQNSSYWLYVTFVSNGYTQHVWAWIDWNQDEVFDNSEFSNEKYNLGEGIDTTLMISIEIPEVAPAGNTRLRVIEQYNTDPSPCDPHETNFGETEDYTVNGSS